MNECKTVTLDQLDRLTAPELKAVLQSIKIASETTALEFIAGHTGMAARIDLVGPVAVAARNNADARQTVAKYYAERISARIRRSGEAAVAELGM